MSFEIRSDKLQSAIRNIERRAEREYDFRKLYDIYVDHGILKELSFKDNQIIYGRRGVGKSHLLSYFRDAVLTQEPNNLFQIHNAMRFGSGTASQSTNSVNIAINMFSQLLNDIATEAFSAADSAEDKKTQLEAAQAIMSFQNIVSKNVVAGGPFDFRNLGDTLDRYREVMKADRMIISIDEWVSIPMSAQPYFAEYIKRAFMVKPRIIFKIAALSYQTKMSICGSPGLSDSGGRMLYAAWAGA